MNLARSLQYFVQVGWTVPITFEWLLQLTGFRAAESRVDRRILGFFIVVPTLIFVASRPSIAVPDLGSAGVAATVASTSQPAVFSRTKEGHERRESCHRFRLFLTKVPG